MTTAEQEKKVEARSVEEIRGELEQAQQALAALRREQAEIASRLKAAGEEDRAELTKAALSGSLKMKTPQLDRVRERAGSLPYLAWAGEVRVLELQEEYTAAKREELEAELQELRPRVEEAEAAFEEAREKLAVARNEHASLLEELRDTDRGRRQRQGRLSQLKAEGPVISHV